MSVASRVVRAVSPGVAPKVWEPSSHRNGLLESVAGAGTFFYDGDFKALQKLSASIHSCVVTLHFGGYGVELQSHATLAHVVNKLPHTLRSRWAEQIGQKMRSLSSSQSRSGFRSKPYVFSSAHLVYKHAPSHA